MGHRGKQRSTALARSVATHKPGERPEAPCLTKAVAEQPNSRHLSLSCPWGLSQETSWCDWNQQVTGLPGAPRTSTNLWVFHSEAHFMASGLWPLASGGWSLACPNSRPQAAGQQVANTAGPQGMKPGLARAGQQSGCLLRVRGGRVTGLPSPHPNRESLPGRATSGR